MAFLNIIPEHPNIPCLALPAQAGAECWNVEAPKGYRIKITPLVFSDNPIRVGVAFFRRCAIMKENEW